MSNSLRIDNLPMDRRTAGVARKVYPSGTSLTGPTGLDAVFEKRDVDPDATVFSRRTGTRRLTNTTPNSPGVTKLKVDDGRVQVAHDFLAGSEIASGTSARWSFAATVKVSTPSDITQDTFFPIASFNGVHLYMAWDISDSGNEVKLFAEDSDGSTTKTIKPDNDGSTDSSAGSYHIGMARTAAGKLEIGIATQGSTTNTDYTLATLHATDTTFENTNGQLELFGTGRQATAPAGAFGDNVVVANAQLWKTGFANAAAFKSAVTDTTPATASSYELIWHQMFNGGGDYQTFNNEVPNPDETYYSYLIPSEPFGDTTGIHFGGQGIAELPFYTDFDDYYYTPQTSTARTNWHLYCKFTTPHRVVDPGSDGDDAHVLFDFQDICKLVMYRVSSGTYRLKAYYGNGGSITVASHANNNLAASTQYQVHVGRDDTNYFIRFTKADGTQEAKVTATASFPPLYDYTSTLSYVIGSSISQSAPLPFDGKIHVLGFWNNTNDTIIDPANTSVFYFDQDSPTGNELRDKGNRELHGFLGTRLPYTTPVYKEGPITEGSYVAATGGYYMTSFLPAPGYSGEITKQITKDAVVQRIGDSSFLVSNGEIYYINDEDKTFRPLGVPRPTSKVSCTPTGIGNINGAVRYAYRYVTKEGTTSPPYMLDAISAPGDCRVMLGADNFGLPGDSPLASSWLRCEGVDVGRGSGNSSNNTNEWAAVYDKQETSGGRILYGDTDTYAPEGLTSEICFKLPNKGRTRELIWEQGVANTVGASSSNMAVVTGVDLKSPWKASGEATMMLAFRYDSGRAHQTLSFVGQREQKFKTARTHYRTPPLHVSIQPSAVANFDYGSSSGGYEDGNTCLFVSRAKKTKGEDYQYVSTSFDYPFEDEHDYVVIVRKGRIDSSSGLGEDLIVHIFDKQYHGNTEAKYHVADGSANGWCKWSEAPSVSNAGVKMATSRGFFGRDNFVGEGGPRPNNIMWGCSRYQDGSLRAYIPGRASAGAGITWDFHCNTFYSRATSSAVGTGVLYHGRWWTKDFAPGEMGLQLLNPGLDGESGIFQRYAGERGTYSDGLFSDVAFCSDSFGELQAKAWDRVKFSNSNFYFAMWNTTKVEPVFQSSVYTPIMSWGYDPIESVTKTLNGEDTRILTPLGVYYSSRNEGSLIVFTGDQISLEVSQKRWYNGTDPNRMTNLLFQDFTAANGGPLDLQYFTWLTLHYSHTSGTDPSDGDTFVQCWLKRIYIDGTEVRDLMGTAHNFQGIGANASDPGGSTNATILDAKMMATLGGAANMDSNETVDIAEFRVWDGDYYQSVWGNGQNRFNHMGIRVPPPLWDKLWYYVRFSKDDVNTAGSLIDNKGQYKETGTGALGGNERQAQADSVGLNYGAAVVDAGDIGDSENTITSNFIPFPSNQLSSIRGIQIFRTQVVPFAELDPVTNKPTPSALEDAMRAVRIAPLYYLDEIPLGNESYEDNTPNELLGAELDTTTADTIPDPGGVVEWEGHLGIWSTTIPRIYWSKKTDLESFPSNYRQELAIREQGPVTAAVELASRDARQSRVFVCGKSWAAFIDGNPINPQMNTIGGGVGSATSRTLVAMNGIAYSYNGSLWAISGDGQVADIGKPVQDLLPTPTSARLSVSSNLASLYVINEDDGICLRYHFPSQEWFVEDRYAMSVTDIDGVDTWVTVSGWPVQGNTSTYADDVESDTPTSVTVSSYDNAANTFVVSSATGLKVGQRLTLIGDRGDGTTTAKPDARIRQTVTIQSISSTTITVNEDLALTANDGSLNYLYTAYPGIGYWGTMLDTGQFNFKGTLNSADIGITSGSTWWATFDANDFARKPTDRTGFNNSESFPTSLAGTSGRWGLTNRQRVERILVWSTKPVASELSEVELNYNKGT
tara:strand:+ start:1728 stop:7358 length:5631 start_codon:yes stop_codon:yes gene_type:complete